MKTRTLKLAFEIGDEVFLKTDTDQERRMVTGLFVTKNEILYYLSRGTYESKHYDFEMSYNKDYKLN